MEDEKTGTDLVTIQNLTMVDLFTKTTMQKLIDEVELVVAEFAPDLTTKKGRDAIASMAMKVSKSKVFLEEKGKDFVADRTKELKDINEVRSYMKERLDKLRDQVRKPLTDWENDEKERIKKLEFRVLGIQGLGMIASQGIALGLVTLRDQLSQLEAIVIDDSFQEYGTKARAEKEGAVKTITFRIQELEKHESDQLELKRLRDLEAAQKKKDHDDAIAKKAKEDADRAAQVELDRKEKEKQDAIDNQKKAEADAAAEKKRADDAIAQAAEDKRLNDLKVENDKKIAAQKADEDKKKAAEAAAAKERQRQQDEKKRQDDDLKKREADTEHRKKINREAMAAIQKVVEGAYADEANAEELSKRIIIALVKNQVPHTKVSY